MNLSNDFIKRHYLKIFFIIIILAASFFRFYRLDDLPPAFDIDEAINSLHGQSALAGEFNVLYTNRLISINEKYQGEYVDEGEKGYYEAYRAQRGPREGLYSNLLAISIYLFGNKPHAVRAVSAILGILTVAGFFFMTREFFLWVFGWRDRARGAPLWTASVSPVSIALFSSSLLAVSFWHTLMSRIAYMHILTPCITVFSFYFLFKGLRSGRFLGFLAGGALLGLAFHTYMSNRILHPVAFFVMILVIIELIMERRSVEKVEDSGGVALFTRNIIIFWVMWLVVAAPLLYYFYSHPDIFLDRAVQVSAFKSTNLMSGLIKNTLLTFAQFSFTSDPVLRHSLPGTALVAWPVAVLFHIGVIVALWGTFNFFRGLIAGNYSGRAHLASLFLLVWFAFALAPAFLSLGPHPHAARSFNAVLPALVLASIGGVFLYGLIKERLKGFSSKRTVAIVAVALVLLTGVLEFKKYFKDWAAEPNIGGVFDEPLYSLAEFIADAPESYKIFVIVNHAPSHVQFLTDTYTAAGRKKRKNIIYILPNRKIHIDFRTAAPYILVALQYEEGQFREIQKNVPGTFTKQEHFNYIVVD